MKSEINSKVKTHLSIILEINIHQVRVMFNSQKNESEVEKDLFAIINILTESTVNGLQYAREKVIQGVFIIWRLFCYID
jgi:hypothetical protein